jgi:hypothetical protein
MGERCKYPPCREPEFCGWAAYCGATDILGDGGTFVLVATEEKLTMVQRPDAEDF